MIERLLRRWEHVSVGVQTAIAVPVCLVFMFLLHLGPFRQPVGRAISYSVFWGLLLAGGVIIATKAERARRRDAARTDNHEGDHP